MTAILNRICNAMLRREVISHEQQTVIRYGLDLLLFSVCSILSLLFIGTLMGRAEETAILLCTFIPLQSFGGGYHCKTRLRCFVMMMSVVFIALILMKNIPLQCLVLLAALCLYPSFVLAPIQHEKAPFSTPFRIRMQHMERCCFIAFIVLSALIWQNGGNPSPVLSGIILSGISISSAYLQNAIAQNEHF